MADTIHIGNNVSRFADVTQPINIHVETSSGESALRGTANPSGVVRRMLTSHDEDPRSRSESRGR